MDVIKITNKFCNEYVLNELRLMSSDKFDCKITYNSLLYLELINCMENCTVSYIADSLKIARSSVTLKVNELEQLGLVTKKQSESDKRVFYLSVTDLADAIFEIDNKAFIKATREIESRFSKKEIENYTEILLIFIKHFKGAIDD